MRLCVAQLLALVVVGVFMLDGISGGPIVTQGKSPYMPDLPDELATSRDDLSMEVHTSSTTKDAMLNNGFGFMVGDNEKSTVPKDLKTKVSSVDSEIARMKGLLDLVTAETEENQKIKEKMDTDRKHKIDDMTASYDAQINQIRQENEEHLSSVKRESAIKMKHVRNAQETMLQQSRFQSEKDNEDFKVEMQHEIESVNAKTEVAKEKMNEANTKAEDIYKRHRAEWKKKHDGELQNHGIHTQISSLSADVAKEHAHVVELADKEAKLKQKLKDRAREKLLMAARLKNLHTQEEAVRGKEKSLKGSNENLKHEVDEVEVTHKESASAIQAQRDAVHQSLVQAAEKAQSKAEKEEKEFQQTTLNNANAEIEKLKGELAVRETQERRAQSEVLQQERNVQAEEKEARDDLAKAKWELEKARNQVALELQYARDEGFNLVNRARKESARIREEARAAGMEAGENEEKHIHDSQSRKEQELVQEEAQSTQLVHEFEAKMERKVKQRKAEEEKHYQEARAEMEVDVEDEAHGLVQHAKDDEQAQLTKAQKEFERAKTHVDETEAKIDSLIRENNNLSEKLKTLNEQKRHQKQLLTEKQLSLW